MLLMLYFLRGVLSNEVKCCQFFIISDTYKLIVVEVIIFVSIYDISVEQNVSSSLSSSIDDIKYEKEEQILQNGFNND